MEDMETVTIVPDPPDARKKKILAAVMLLLRKMSEYHYLWQKIEDEIDESSDEDLKSMEQVKSRPLVITPKIDIPLLELINCDFKMHFKINRTTFEALLSIIGKNLKRKKKGKAMVPPEKQLLAAIWKMTSEVSYTTISDTLKMSKNTSFNCILRVVENLLVLEPTLIQWPSREGAQKIIQDFRNASRLPNVIGAIDGTHVIIQKPKDSSEVFLNEAGDHSVQLQAVCDYKGKILNCYVSQPGSVHDQQVLQQSPLAQFLGDKEKFYDNCHLVGDAGYKLHENLMIPYRDNGKLLEKQKFYNFCHSSARMAIKRTFNLLRGRFKSIANCLAITTLEDIQKYVTAICILHNFCLINGDQFECDEMEYTMDSLVIVPQDNDAEQSAANIKRDLLCQTVLMS